jgi:hypothetical protein
MVSTRGDIIPGTEIPSELVDNLFPKGGLPPLGRLTDQPSPTGKIVYVVAARHAKSGPKSIQHTPGALAAANEAIAAGFNACVLFYQSEHDDLFRATVFDPAVAGLVFLSDDGLPETARRRFEALALELVEVGKRVTTSVKEIVAPSRAQPAASIFAASATDRDFDASKGRRRDETAADGTDVVRTFDASTGQFREHNAVPV